MVAAVTCQQPGTLPLRRDQLLPGLGALPKFGNAIGVLEIQSEIQNGWMYLV